MPSLSPVLVLLLPCSRPLPLPFPSRQRPHSARARPPARASRSARLCWTAVPRWICATLPDTAQLTLPRGMSLVVHPGLASYYPCPTCSPAADVLPHRLSDGPFPPREVRARSWPAASLLALLLHGGVVDAGGQCPPGLRASAHKRRSRRSLDALANRAFLSQAQAGFHKFLVTADPYYNEVCLGGGEVPLLLGY